MAKMSRMAARFPWLLHSQHNLTSFHRIFLIITVIIVNYYYHDSMNHNPSHQYLLVFSYPFSIGLVP